MRVQVLLFASLREIAGSGEVVLELANGSTVAELDEEMQRRWPEFGAIPYVFAVDRAYAERDRVLLDGAEVALVPPISGGDVAGDEDSDDNNQSDAPARFVFAFRHDAIDARALEAAVRSDADGALVTFVGVTRDHHEGKAVKRLAYEAFEAMAIERGVELIASVVGDREVGRVHIEHRLGVVPIGEASIVVCVAAPHRGPAFEVAREAMDRIKAELPIFKKEVFVEGDAEAERWIGDLPKPG